jgi:4-alpha-glucanotransferase
LALLPLEDALALEEQPNVPGTIEQHPNWRRRYDGEAADLLDRPEVRERLKPLAERRGL